MTFQIALDAFPLDEAIAKADQLKDLVEVLEVGTPLSYLEGRYGIQAMHEHFPNHQVLADFKIMDGGALEAHIAFAAGASYVTVCGLANLSTITGVIEQARKDGGKVMIDMIETPNLEERLRVCDELGADLIQIHTAFDGRGDKSPVNDLALAKKVLKKTNCAVAGGIGLHNIREIAALKPDHVVVGSRLFAAENLAEEMKAIRMAAMEG